MSDTTPTAPTETDPNATDNAAGAADNFADGSQLARCTLIDRCLVSSQMTLLCMDCTPCTESDCVRSVGTNQCTRAGLRRTVGGFEAASCSESLFVARQWLPVTDRHTSTIAGSRSLIWLQRRDAGGDVFSEPCVSQIVRSARKVVASWSMNRGVDARTSI